MSPPPMGPPPGRRLRDPNIKVPVFKNIAYALKLVWQCDKSLFVCYIIRYLANDIFSKFIQNILFLKVILSILDSSGSFESYFKTLLTFLIVSVTLFGINWLTAYIIQVTDKKVLKKLNNMVFSKAITLDVECYENPEFYNKYQRAIDVLAWGYFDAVCQCVAAIFSSILALCLVIGTVASIDPHYLIFLVPVALVFVLETFKSKVVFKREMEMTKNNRIKAYIQRTVFLKDFSKDIRTSNIFAVLMLRFKAAIASNVEILKKYGVKLFVYSLVSSLFSEFIPIVGTYAYATYQFVYTNLLTVSGFSVVLSAINSVRETTMSVAMNFKSLVSLALYFQNLREFFDYEPKILSGEKEPEEFKSLEFKNVTFQYPAAKKPTLKNISFKLEKGETLAVVGVNGAGKSTLVKLLLRFYDVTSGEILYNGVNIKEYDLTAYRNIYGAVFQDYKNFALSVYENVICHECSEEEKGRAKNALMRSGVWDKIASLENGGDTVMTREFDKNGAGLSGGENQKVSAARLFAKDFQCAILDEPSSALDPIAEYKMYENLIDVTKDKAVLYISHRLSSATLSDKIIVIDGGEIIQEGTHQSLMECEGQYKEMFTLQASSYKEERQERTNE